MVEPRPPFVIEQALTILEIRARGNLAADHQLARPAFAHAGKRSVGGNRVVVYRRVPRTSPSSRF
jgi:hypothetical protein